MDFFFIQMSDPQFAMFARLKCRTYGARQIP